MNICVPGFMWIFDFSSQEWILLNRFHSLIQYLYAKIKKNDQPVFQTCCIILKSNFYKSSSTLVIIYLILTILVCLKLYLILHLICTFKTTLRIF